MSWDPVTSQTPRSPDYDLQKSFRACGVTVLHTEQPRPRGPHGLDTGTDMQTDTSQLIPLRPGDEVQGCAGPGRVRGAPQRGCPSRVLRAGRDCQVEKGRGRASHGPGCHLQAREITGMRTEAHLFGYCRFKLFSSILTAGPRILRVGSVGGGGGKGKEKLESLGQACKIFFKY